MTNIVQHQLVYVPNEGHLVFKVWSRETTSYIWVVLSAQHVCNAFNIRHPAMSWAMNGSSMAKMLMRYIGMVRNTPFIFSIMMNGADVYDVLRPYITSFEIANNVNPRVIQVLYHWQKNCRGAGAHDFYIVDYDMNEMRGNREDYICPVV